MRLWGFLSEHVWKQCKCVTGLRWWCCTELPPSVMDLLQRYLNLHSFPPAFADGAHSCHFYLRTCFGAACLTSHCFYRGLLINVALTVDVSECCSIVLPLYHHVCRCAPTETHSRTLRLQILFHYQKYSFMKMNVFHHRIAVVWNSW